MFMWCRYFKAAEEPSPSAQPIRSSSSRYKSRYLMRTQAEFEAMFSCKAPAGQLMGSACSSCIKLITIQSMHCCHRLHSHGHSSASMLWNRLKKLPRSKKTKTYSSMISCFHLWAASHWFP